METLKEETKNNYPAFKERLKSNLESTTNTLSLKDDKFVPSYQRITSIQAWKVCLLLPKYGGNEALGFIYEAHNDALTSHALAKSGFWRGAHQFLRSLIENTLYFIYYKDHLVEYELWKQGNHWMPFKDLCSYISSHPKYLSFIGNREEISGLAALKGEYGKLSDAVHGSLNARMANELDFPNMFNSNLPELGKWSTNELSTLTAINKILIFFFREDLSGTSHERLRKSISLCIHEAAYKEKIYEQIHVRLF